MTDDRVMRLQKVVSRRGDVFEASVCCHFENGSTREFIAGHAADPFEAADMAMSLERRLITPPAAG